MTVDHETAPAGRPMRVGVVGVGQNSGVKLHCQPLAGYEAARLVAVCDQSAERVAAASGQFDVRGYTAYEAFLADDEIDIVTVATPPFLHAPMAIQALRAGKHVVVEKPMCLSVAEADAMIAAADAAGRTLTVFQNRRWDADYLAVRRAIQDGAIGKPWLIESRFASGPAYGAAEYRASWFQERSYGGGWLLGWGSHLFDQVLQMVPSAPRRVFAIAQSTVWSRDADDYFKTLIRFEDGTTAMVEAAMNDKIAPRRWYVRGTTGSLRKQTIGADTPVEVSRMVPGTQNAEFAGIGERIDVQLLRRDSATVCRLFYAGLAEALRDGTEPPVKATQSRLAMQVIEASFRSAAEGSAVELL